MAPHRSPWAPTLTPPQLAAPGNEEARPGDPNPLNSSASLPGPQVLWRSSSPRAPAPRPRQRAGQERTRPARPHPGQRTSPSRKLPGKRPRRRCGASSPAPGPRAFHPPPPSGATARTPAHEGWEGGEPGLDCLGWESKSPGRRPRVAPPAPAPQAPGRARPQVFPSVSHLPARWPQRCGGGPGSLLRLRPAPPGLNPPAPPLGGPALVWGRRGHVGLRTGGAGGSLESRSGPARAPRAPPPRLCAPPGEEGAAAEEQGPLPLSTPPRESPRRHAGGRPRGAGCALRPPSRWALEWSLQGKCGPARGRRWFHFPKRGFIDPDPARLCSLPWGRLPARLLSPGSGCPPRLLSVTAAPSPPRPRGDVSCPQQVSSRS